MYLIIYTVMIASLVLGIISVVNYLSHPLANSGLIRYSGGKFWLISLVCALTIYLKG